MSNEQRNMFIAIGLSLIVVFGWQFLIVTPQMDEMQRQAEIAAQEAGDSGTADVNITSDTGVEGTTEIAAAPQTAATFEDRAAALASQPRVQINTASLTGSINLIGGRIDDVALKNYRETVDPTSPMIDLLAPANGPEGYYVEQGWVAPSENVTVPDSRSEWTAEPGAVLTEATPLTLSFDNGEGLKFLRTISVDDNFLFTVTQSVENSGAGDVALFPYARVVRQSVPKLANFFILHEGPVGVMGENNLVEKSYNDLVKERQVDFEATEGWLGFVDKYWAAAVIPAPGTSFSARFSARGVEGSEIYETNFVSQAPLVAAAGGSASSTSYVYAGAKIEAVIDNYEQTYGFNHLELLIDWGWFHFLTKPMFYLIRFLHGVLGNFGFAILAVTLIVKILFFPLANRSYASMAKMRKVQPELKALQERHKDDKAEQQKAMMELYAREKINPISGCWPTLLQIPVFFSLYKVLFVTIEMRHAPFFGWIQDLAAPDPTHVFNLFGLLPYDPLSVPVIGTFLAIGIWPVIMGISMWVQMRLNPPPTDPTQAMIFGLMPIMFTFMLGTFPAGLVIYWAWNNSLSIAQQWTIMKRHGAEVNLFGNIMDAFKRKKPAEDKSGK